MARQLVADGDLYTRRGVAVFVATGARERLLERRRGEFAGQDVRAPTTEARALGIPTREPALGAPGAVLAWLGAWGDIGSWLADQSTSTLTIGRPLAFVAVLAAPSSTADRRTVSRRRSTLHRGPSVT